MVLVAQLGCALWASLKGTANDKIDGFEKAATFALEAAATFCMLVGNLISSPAGDSASGANQTGANQTGADDTDPLAEVQTVALQLQIAVVSANLLMAAVFVPLGISLYNSL